MNNLEFYENLNFITDEIKKISGLEKITFQDILPNEEIQNFILVKENKISINENTKRLDIFFSVFVQNLEFFKAKKYIWEIYKKFRYENQKLVKYKDNDIPILLLIAKDCPESLYQVNKGSYQFVCNFDLSISLEEIE